MAVLMRVTSWFSLSRFQKMSFSHSEKGRRSSPPQALVLSTQKKMVRPGARRALVHWAREAYQLSERRACRSVGVYRALIRDRSGRPSQGAVTGAAA